MKIRFVSEEVAGINWGEAPVDGAKAAPPRAPDLPHIFSDQPPGTYVLRKFAAKTNESGKCEVQHDEHRARLEPLQIAAWKRRNKGPRFDRPPRGFPWTACHQRTLRAVEARELRSIVPACLAEGVQGQLRRRQPGARRVHRRKLAADFGQHGFQG